jgi:prepilin-type N-terminal cleavage/methylation domain-containing protein
MMNDRGTMKKLTFHRRARRQRGMTIIETMIAVTIGVVIVALAIKGVGGILADSRSSSEVGELPTIFSNLQKVYSQRSSFAGATQAIFVNNQAFPSSMVTSGSTNVTNRWGGAVTVAVTSITGGTNNALTYETTGVPSSECASVIPQLDNVVRVVTVNGTSVKADRNSTDLSALGTACSTTSSNDVIYTISK